MAAAAVEYVQFPVPKDRVPDVAVFLYGSREAAPETVEQETEPLDTPAEPTDLSAEERRKLHERIYRESEPTFRKLLLLLSGRDQPDERISYADFTALMDYESNSQLPGALGAYGRRAKHRYDGHWPFVRVWDPDEWSHYLRMPDDIAADFQAIHAAEQRPTEW